MIISISKLDFSEESYLLLVPDPAGALLCRAKGRCDSLTLFLISIITAE